MLSKAAIEQYKSEGYCVCPQFLSTSEVNGLLQEIESISGGATLAQHDGTRLEMEPKQPADGTKVRRIYQPCTHYQVFRDLSESPALVNSLVQLIGPDILCFSSKINIKPPEIGSVVEWHQDMAYGPVTNRSMLAVLIYLDDADATNGCLQVIPGNIGMLNHSHEGFFQGKITEPVDVSKAVLVEGPRGTATFFSGLVPHASRANTSPRPRRTLIIECRAADAFPIHIGPKTEEGQRFVRVIHGKPSSVARFDLESVFIPRYPADTKSLYEIQEYSQKHPATSPENTVSMAGLV